MLSNTITTTAVQLTPQQEEQVLQLALAKGQAISSSAQSLVASNSFVFFAGFDGTDNSYVPTNGDLQNTAIAQLFDQVKSAEDGLSAAAYYAGVGTPSAQAPSDWYSPDVAMQSVNTAQKAYDAFALSAFLWLQDNRAGTVTSMIAGFSRGCAAEAIFVQMLYENGLVYTDSSGVKHKMIPAGSNDAVSAALAIDPVLTGEFGTLGLGNKNVNLDFPPGVNNLTVVRAQQEYRDAFDAADYGADNDKVISVPGAHADVGDAYDNGLGGIYLGAYTSFFANAGLNISQPIAARSYSPGNSITIHSEVVVAGENVGQFDQKRLYDESWYNPPSSISNGVSVVDIYIPRDAISAGSPVSTVGNATIFTDYQGSLVVGGEGYSASIKSGSVILLPYSSASITLSGGTITLDADATLTLPGSTGSLTKVYLTENDVLIIATPSNFTGAIYGFNPSNTIDLARVGTATNAVLDPGNILYVDESDGSNLTLRLDPTKDYSDAAFIVTADGDGGTDISLLSGSQTTTLTGSNGALFFSSPDTLRGTISDYAPGDKIDIGASSVSTSLKVGASNVLTLGDTPAGTPSGGLQLDLGQDLTSFQLNYSSDGNGGIDVTAGSADSSGASGGVTISTNADGSMTLLLGSKSVAVPTSDIPTVEVVGSYTYLIDVTEPSTSVVIEQIIYNPNGITEDTTYSDDGGVDSITTQGDELDLSGGVSITMVTDPSTFDDITTYSGETSAPAPIMVPSSTSNYTQYYWIAGDGEFEAAGNWSVPAYNPGAHPPQPVPDAPGSNSDVQFNIDGIVTGDANVNSIVVSAGISLEFAGVIQTGTLEDYGTVTFDQAVQASSFDSTDSIALTALVEASYLSNEGVMMVAGEVVAGFLSNTGTLDVAGSIILGSIADRVHGNLSNSGDLVVTGLVDIVNASDGDSFENNGDIDVQGTLIIAGSQDAFGVDELNQGTLTVEGVFFAPLASLGYTGSLTVNSGGYATLGLLTESGGTAAIADGGTLSVYGIDLEANGILTVKGARALVNIHARLDIGQDYLGFYTPSGGGVATISDGAQLLAAGIELGGYDETGADVSGSLTIETDAAVTVTGGVFAEMDGSVIVQGAGSTLNAAYIDLGGTAATASTDGGASLMVSGGARFTGGLVIGTPSNDQLGFNAGFTTATIDGAATTADLLGNLRISAGAVTVSNGAQVDLGQAPSGSMNYVLGGASKQQIGYFGSGTLTVESGSTVMADANATADESSAAFGVSTGDDGIGIVTGANTLLDFGDETLAIGVQGTGLLTIDEGGTVDAGEIDIAQQTGAQGTVMVQDVNSSLFGTDLEVGGSSGYVGGAGALTITNSAVVSAAFAHVWAGGVVTLDGSSLETNDITIDTGGAVDGVGTLTGDIINNGEITAKGGLLDLTGSISGNGALTIASGATLEVDGTVEPDGALAFDAQAISGITIQFAGADAVLDIGDPADAPGTIGGFGASDVIDLVDDTYETGDQATLITGNVLEVTEVNGHVVDMQLDPTADYSASSFNLGSDGTSGTDVTTSIACFLAGTSIATDRGEVKVEELAIGARVRTVGGVLRPVKWIGQRSYARAFVANNPEITPIRIDVGALAEGVPTQDLYVSPLHALFIEGVLIPAKHLVNGVTIRPSPEIDPILYFHVELDDHDVIFAEGAAAETFVDCDSRGMFQNAAEFTALYPGDATPRWAFCAPRVEGGHLLEDIRAKISARAGIGGGVQREARQAGELRGVLDGATCEVIRGWAWQSEHPDEPARLEILVGDGVIGQVVANGSRPDVRDAGHGDGRCGYTLRLAHPLSPFMRHVIRVRRISDHAVPSNAPDAIIEPTAKLDAAALAGLSSALRATASAADRAEREALVRFMAAETDMLRTAHVRGGGKGRRDPRPLALFIDETLPARDHDAGSNAALDHIRSLQQLGYRVAFAARDVAAPGADVTHLEAQGVTGCLPSATASVEETLRRLGDDVALIYLHRVGTASLYMSLARHHCPKARVVYSVADLHFVRLARQAALEGSTALAAESRRVRARELLSAEAADGVITHSGDEAALLRKHLPAAKVHVVPWSVAARPGAVPFGKRQGVAFIGGYRHGANIDAARWLVRDVMPLVWRHDPGIECLLVGSNMPRALQRITRKGVVPLGHVADLRTVFDRVRLTAAPLRYGAGLKGKVLDSLAAGVPCVCTPIAAEGLALPAELQGCIGTGADELAALIIRLHSDESCNVDCAEAGLQFVRKEFSVEQVDGLMMKAIGEAGRPVVRARLASSHGMKAAS